MSKKLTWCCNTEKLIQIISLQNSLRLVLPEIFLSKWSIQFKVHRIAKEQRSVENETISSADETSATIIRRQDYLLEFFLIRDSDSKLKHTSVEANFLVNLSGMNKKGDIIKDLTPYHIGSCRISNFDKIDYKIYLTLTFKDVTGLYDRLSRGFEVDKEEVGQAVLKKPLELVEQKKREDLIDNNAQNQDLISWETVEQTETFCEITEEYIPSGSFELNIPSKKDVSERTHTETPNNEMAGPSEQKKGSEDMLNKISNNAGAKKEQNNRSKQYGNSLKHILKNNKILDENEFCPQSCQLVPEKHIAAGESLQVEHKLENTEMNEQVQENLKSGFYEDIHLSKFTTEKNEAKSTGMKEKNSELALKLKQIEKIKQDLLLKQSNKSTPNKDLHLCEFNIQSAKAKNTGINVIEIENEIKKALLLKQSKETTSSEVSNSSKLNSETIKLVKSNITEEIELLTTKSSNKVVKESDETEEIIKILRSINPNIKIKSESILNEAADPSNNIESSTLPEKTDSKMNELIEQNLKFLYSTLEQLAEGSNKSEDSELPEQNKENDETENRELSKQIEQISTNKLIGQSETYQPNKLIEQIEDIETNKIFERILEADTETKSSNKVAIKSDEVEEIQILKQSELILNEAADQSKDFESNKQTGKTENSKMNELFEQTLKFLYSTLEKLAKGSNISENSELLEQNKKNDKTNDEFVEQIERTSINDTIDESKTYQSNKLMEQTEDMETNEMLEQNSKIDLDIKVRKDDETEKNSKKNEESIEQNSRTDANDLMEENDLREISEILEQKEKTESNETSDFLVKKDEINMTGQREESKLLPQGDLSSEESKTNIEKQIDQPRLTNKEHEKPETNVEKHINQPTLPDNKLEEPDGNV